MDALGCARGTSRSDPLGLGRAEPTHVHSTTCAMRPSGILSGTVVPTVIFGQFQLSFAAKPRRIPRSSGHARSTEGIRCRAQNTTASAHWVRCSNFGTSRVRDRDCVSPWTCADAGTILVEQMRPPILRYPVQARSLPSHMDVDVSVDAICGGCMALSFRSPFSPAQPRSRRDATFSQWRWRDAVFALDDPSKLACLVFPFRWIVPCLRLATGAARCQCDRLLAMARRNVRRSIRGEARNGSSLRSQAVTTRCVLPIA